ncbi:MAG: hypothetical protein ACRYFS_20800 [Janthinobacterium lividum]
MPLTQVEYHNVYASAGRHFLAQAGEFADAFSAMLSAAEDEFGPRDPSYTVWSVEFGRKSPGTAGFGFRHHLETASGRAWVSPYHSRIDLAEMPRGI